MKLYLVREPELYNGSCYITNYVPYKSSHGILKWWFWGHLRVPASICLDVRKDDFLTLQEALGFKVDFGMCVDLTTHEILTLDNAEELPSARQ
jgi:hypothetical protein